MSRSGIPRFWVLPVVGVQVCREVVTILENNTTSKQGTGPPSLGTSEPFLLLIMPQITHFEVHGINSVVLAEWGNLN